MGLDRIPNIVLKTCAEELAPCLSNIFQKLVDSSTLPNDWLIASIAPVLEKGDVHAASKSTGSFKWRYSYIVLLFGFHVISEWF
jgi:hypothetical protein